MSHTLQSKYFNKFCERACSAAPAPAQWQIHQLAVETWDTLRLNCECYGMGNWFGDDIGIAVRISLGTLQHGIDNGRGLELNPTWNWKWNARSELGNKTFLGVYVGPANLQLTTLVFEWLVD